MSKCPVKRQKPKAWEHSSSLILLHNELPLLKMQRIYDKTEVKPEAHKK